MKLSPRAIVRRVAAFLAPRRQRALHQLPYLPRVLGLIWGAAPRPTLAWAVLMVTLGLVPAITVALAGRLVDALTQSIASGGAAADLRLAAPIGLALVATMVASMVLEALLRVVRTAQAGLVQDHIGGLVYEQSAAVDFDFYDSPAYYDRLHRARTGAGQRPMALLESAGGLVQAAITFTAMTSLLMPLGAALPAALALSAVPTLFVVLHHRMRLHRWRMAATRDERRTWYLDWLLTARDNAAEIRSLGLGPHFQGAFGRIREGLRQQQLALVRDQSLAQLGAGAAALAIAGGAMAWLIWRTALGQVSPGQLTTAFLAFTQGQRLLGALLGNVGDIYENSLYLADLFEFLGLPREAAGPEEPDQPPPVLREGIRFEGVRFCYPSGRRDALDGLDLTIAAGRVTALVGTNGAGKSTLIKLLCRMYDPDDGRITLDGVDLRRFALADLRRHMTILFQEPVHYAETVAENIALGDRDASPDLAAVEAAARAAGADEPVAHLPDGYATLLGTWFEGGTDLSVGEWQRIALARAFLRQAPIVVLDEPTSAMDSWAEADWLARFAGLAAGRTVLVITHRFTTAMRADTIHVMDEGRIVESGDHAALVAAGGRYAASWAAQMNGGGGA